MQASEINVMIFWVCVTIGAVVYATIIWSLVVYRRSRKHETSFHKNTATEIAWTVIPLLIIIAMTIPAAKVLTRFYQGDNRAGEGRRMELVGDGNRQLVMAHGLSRTGLIHSDTDLI